MERLEPLGVYKNLELQGIRPKRRTWWAQIYDKTDGKFREIFINKESIIKYKGERIRMEAFKR